MGRRGEGEVRGVGEEGGRGKGASPRRAPRIAGSCPSLIQGGLAGGTGRGGDQGDKDEVKGWRGVSVKEWWGEN